MSLEKAIAELTEATKALTLSFQKVAFTDVLSDDVAGARATGERAAGEAIAESSGAQTGAAEVAEPQAATATPPATPKPPTKKLVAEVAVELGKFDRDALTKVIDSFGVAKVPQLTEDQRTPFINACEDAMKGGGEVEAAVEATAEIVAVTFDSIKEMITTLATTGKTADVVAALQANKVAKATELKPEQYEAFAKQLSESL